MRYANRPDAPVSEGSRRILRLSILRKPWSQAFDFRFIFAYPVLVEQPNGAPGKIGYLGACLVAAVQENWNNSPRVVSRMMLCIAR